MTRKLFKNFLKYPINVEVVPKCQGANYKNVYIFLAETNIFKQHLKEALLINKDQPKFKIEIFIAISWSFLVNHYITIFRQNILTTIKINKMFDLSIL